MSSSHPSAPGLNGLTILIPTRNRAQYLARLLGVYNRIGFPFRIHVEDSSDGYNLDAMRDWIRQSFSNLSISYATHPSSISPLIKIQKGLGRVDSPLVAILADDDFYLPGALAAHAAWLDGHPDVAAVVGSAFRFQILRDRPVDPGELVWGCYAQRGLEDQDSRKRLRRHAAYYTTNFYCVQRTRHLKEAFSAVEFAGQDYYLMELTLSCLQLAAGPVACMRQPFLLREREAPKDYKVRSLYEWATSIRKADGGLGNRLKTIDRILQERSAEQIGTHGLDTQRFIELYLGSQLFCQSRLLTQLRRHRFAGLGEVWNLWRKFRPELDFTRREISAASKAVDAEVTPLFGTHHGDDRNALQVIDDALRQPICSPLPVTSCALDG
jgi:glycosyltransferase domain-containing protein